MRRFVNAIIIIFLFFIGLLLFTYYWTVPQMQTKYSGTVTLDGLKNDVTINFDDFGVPYIEADSQSDAIFALGYLHASERMWQMTLSQLSVEGRFAEFLGTDALPFDRFLRTLDVKSTAQKSYVLLSGQEKELLQTYSDGVNAWIENHQQNLPIEFTLLEMKPIEWKPIHSIGIARLMAWQLNVSYWSEVALASLQATLPPNKFRELLAENWPSEPGSVKKSTASVLRSFMNTDQAFRNALNLRGDHVGSNAWAISGERSQSGLPMLAGDPHLGVGIPPFWYETTLTWGNEWISGASLPGVPGIVLGRNKHLAWSFTNVMADDTDFFIETVAGDGLVKRGNTVESIEMKQSMIRIKGGAEEVFTRRSTSNGVVINDVYDVPELLPDTLVTMNWMGFIPSNELSALFKLNSATSQADIMEAAKEFHVPAQNWVFATNSGEFGRITAGKLPIRSQNFPLLRPGANAKSAWAGFIPFEELPHELSPTKGWVASANTKIHDKNYPHYISRYWEPTSRQNRIDSILDTLKNATTEHFAQLQNDVYSDHSKKLVDKILPILEKNSEDEEIAQILTYLKNWDYKYDLKSTAASITDVFFIEFTKNTLLDELGEIAFNQLVRLENLPVRIMNHLLRTNSTFFDNVNTEEVETLDAIVMTSMKAAFLSLKTDLGEESYQWRWENLHRVTFSPALFADAAKSEDAPGTLKLIVKNLLSRGPYSTTGHGMTVNNGQYSWEDPFHMTLGPSIRRIIDLGNREFGLSVLPTGQSGNQLSPHFDNQIHMWLGGTYRPIFTSSRAMKETRNYSSLLLQSRR